MVKLLLDANLSWRLAKPLEIYFAGIIHVDKSPLSVPAKDREIWKYARDNNFIIVTNDEDFQNLSNLLGFPPKVVILRTGNLHTSFVLQLLIKHKADIESLYLATDYGLIEIY